MNNPTQTNVSNISLHTPLHLGLNVAAEPQTHGYMSSSSLPSPSNLPPPREVRSTFASVSLITRSSASLDKTKTLTTAAHPR